jgi:competence ComEA-like helix-hairpin-helix protein
MTTHLNSQSLFPVLRRAMALVALCVVIAAATATWLTSDPAQAGPRLDQPAQTARRTAPAKQTAPGKATTPRADADADADADDAPPKKGGKVITGKLNLNTASEDQLRMLPGVGPAKAQRIIEHRNTRGKYQRVRDLRRVSGFGYKTVQKLTPYLTVQGETTLKVE